MPDERAPVRAWLEGFGPTDGANGVRLVEGLAIVATTPLGSRAEARSAGLLLDPVTAADRLHALVCLKGIGQSAEVGGRLMTERACEILKTPAIVEAWASVAFGTTLHGDPPQAVD